MTRKAAFQVLTVCLIFVSVFGLAACSSTGNEKAGKKKVELTWLVRSDPVLKAWEEKMVKDFEAENPDIKIKLQEIPQEQIDQKLQTMIAGGNVPDVWSSNWADSGFATYQELGALLDLSPYLEKDPDAVEGIDEKLIDIYTIDGKKYGVPILAMGSYIFYNKELFDEAGLDYPPTDWDDESWNYDTMVDYAKKLTKNIGDKNNQVFGLLNTNHGNRDAWLWGGDLFKEEAYETGAIGEPNVLDDPANRQAIQAHYDLIHEHKVSPTQSQLDAVSQIGDPFLTGRVAMTINGGWGVRSYQPAEFQWGIAPMPYTVDNRRIPMYVDPWNISAKSKHPDEAWEFIKFLIDPEKGAKELVEMTNETPANSQLMDLWLDHVAEQAGMTNEQLKELHEGAIKYGFEADNHLIRNFSTILNTINQNINAIYDGTKDIDEGLNDLDAQLRATGDK
ncbi:sugar ABC transporter substrate-binding protein [Bacillus sp. J14TS2]|uniref:ABC transporter substrate-binding protein n=1 Tax=Bacillus sp. J14TS2 TaxID=2807188 RepID=UPI001B262F43|nr:sugar ABC transporter substrate-binding protein [Bacillus sp. J14TS2]GIN70852.1 sugar ABC transporter substrate-binding protein [Bacillus sp. J14TS2]